MRRASQETASELTFVEALTEAAAVVNSSLHFEQVLDRILEQVARVVPGDTYNVMLLDGETGRIVRWRGYEETGVPTIGIGHEPTDLRNYPTFREMMATGDPIIVDDTASSDIWIREPGRPDQRAYLGTPICVDGHTVGFINVSSKRTGEFSTRDALRLRAFADHAAIALQNARLYQAVRLHAEELEHRVRLRTQELEARTAWSEAILRSTSDRIIVTNESGEIIQMNPVATRWLQAELSPDDAEILRDAVRTIARGAKDQSEKLVELTGTDLELRAAPVYAAGAQSSAIVVAGHDVSQLRALDRMKAQFISDVSHELRTPIAAIRLYSSLMKKHVTPQQESYLASLDEEVDRLSRLVEGILQIARIEAGRLELNRKYMDLNLLASTAASSYTGIAEARGLRLEYRAPSEPLPVHVDPYWFIQAIEKLVQNAIDYTLVGKITLTTGQHQQDTRKWAWLAVEDTGIGIPEHEQPRLFERFYRGEEARLRSVPGSGLGLAIAKGVLELHGGQIAVQSQPGRGSQFTITIPLAPQTR